MSAGSPRIVLRVQGEMLARIHAAVEKRNQQPGAVRDWNVTEYVKQAIADKLSHDARSRARRQNKHGRTMDCFLDIDEDERRMRLEMCDYVEELKLPEIAG